MNDIRISDMLAMQHALYEHHKDAWTPRTPQTGRDMLLWLVEEVGEMAAIIKKQGDDAIMHDAATRAHFVEEMADVMMYLHEVMICYGIDAQEFSQAYVEKHTRNITRKY